MYRTEKRLSNIVLMFAGLAIIIACLGVFALTSFTAAQRTKEIGIRKVLGASVSSIVIMLSKDFLQLVVLSIVIASPVAYYFLQQWLQNFAYPINISWWIFVMAVFSPILIAIIPV